MSHNFVSPKRFIIIYYIFAIKGCISRDEFVNNFQVFSNSKTRLVFSSFATSVVKITRADLDIKIDVWREF